MRIRLPKKPSGFSLVVTLAMMILLTVIAVGLLSLAGVATRSESINKAELEARANARMALMMAIDRLQTELGPDQRISANSAITSDSAISHPHWLGVWDSWVAGSVDEAPINPNYPSTDSHHQTIGNASDDSMRPDYGNKDDYFRSWLVSLPQNSRSNISSPADLALDARYRPSLANNASILVGEGTLGEGIANEETVAAGLIPIKEDPNSGEITGRYSWWVSDQSQKASIMADSYAGTSSLSAASLLQRMQAPASMGNGKIQGIENAEEGDFTKLASMKSLDLIDGVAEGVEPSKVNFHTASTYNLGVLADVREGGLKRDLSTLLEREILLEDNGDEFMLYKFNGDDERVPIQDLSAFYQLYKDDESWSEGGRSGIKYRSDQAGLLTNAMQVEIPDYAHASGRDKYLREYSSMYRSPVPIKVQFVMAVGAVPITPEEREYIRQQAEISLAATNPNELSGFRKPLRDTDTHKLRMGIMPVVSMWNPTNVPLVMDKQMIFKAGCPPFAFRWKKYRAGEDPNRPYRSPYFNINASMSPTLLDGRVDVNTPNIIQMQIPGKEPVVFAPGEVILFSIDPVALDPDLKLIQGGTGANSFVKAVHQARTGADLDGFIVCPTAATCRVNKPRGHGITYPLDPNTHMGALHQPDIYNYGNNDPFPAQGFMVFNPDDTITIEAVQESRQHQRIHDSVQRDNFGFNVSHSAETHGSGFSFYMHDERHEARDFLRQSQLLSRFCSDGFWVEPELTDFNGQLMLQGMPGNTQLFSANATDSILGSQIINATRDQDVVAMLEFTMNAACESSELSVGGYAGGRRAATRPFLHSQIISPPFIDHNGKAAMYNYGWDWQLTRINSLDESMVGGKPGTRNDYYGGGYTIEAGVTHVVQQHLPVIPPMSIAELSHAHLGGYSLANNAVVGDGEADNIDSSDWHQFTRFRKGSDLKWPAADGFRRTTAVGFGGLAPSVVQAIGNSYAHPNIPADKAFKSWDRFFDQDFGVEQRTFVDHSYLANKALWDDCYFSSITPKPGSVEILDATGLTGPEVAEDFLFEGAPLPNRRFIPYVSNLSQDEFPGLAATYGDYAGGFSDRVSSHMMVNGPFNVNSTSVEAWKIFLSSLHGKAAPYYQDENGYAVRAPSNTEGVSVSQGMLANGEPITTSEIGDDPNLPGDQWTRSRILSDEEIEELATAMVEQVKARGPFLSLSEFINRRLDASDAELALKGALQAALDDDSVSINEAFRNRTRTLDAEAAAVINGSDANNGGAVEFPEALEGPIAYGSTPYVDQADLLRGMSSVLTPRGDTFVVRAYGDSLNKKGQVEARAWCEAVVQRLPEYVDGRDDPHVKQSDLPSTSSSRFMGRKFEIVSFRWLHQSEI